MTEKTNLESYRNQHMHCSVRLKGHLNQHWSHWFDGMAISKEKNGETLLTGPVVDQAALHGLLRKVRDIGIPLISVTTNQAIK